MKISKIELARQAFKHKGFIQKVPIIYRMMKSVASKDGYKPETVNLLIPGLVLAYLISPIDLIPDWFLGIGALDDLALLALAIPMLINETEKFVAWEAQKNANVKNIAEAEIVE